MTTEITTAEELSELLGTPTRRALGKERTVLHERDREWLASSPFCLVATAGADGGCDVSPKGDPPGFTVVLDEATIAIPERPGNRRADGYRNILANPHVGLVYLIPSRTDTLRINGRARLVRDAPYFADMVVKGHRPVLAVEVAIEQIFYHCPKAFLRSGLWQPETWRPDVLPTRARLVKEVEAPADSLADLERHYGPDYVKTIYS
ncbi:pyridoxamine 5'-phosphate oxidase family protein [Micromonospora sp. SL1-18]|uniref:pyridoxamine 5'-phosphate oxidase family protein n=1 Tax=Micromonospora sp. SL1-18 TaxID=3399128 RepID=UPI003A4DFC0B